MSTKKGNPPKDIAYIQNHINKLLDEAIIRSISATKTEKATWVPPVDIYETEKNIILKIEIPGLDEKDITVEVKGNILTLKGEKKLKKKLNDEIFLRTERYYGYFRRCFNLPSTIQKDKMIAQCKDGVLKLVLPKKNDENKNLIKVKVNYNGKGYE